VGFVSGLTQNLSILRFFDHVKISLS
jgi:hypothetical protein